jgi:hypothetical protein
MFGWVPNPDGVGRVLASLPHPGQLAAAAPHLMGDGQTGDLMPYLAWYEVEILGGDGTVWKAKDAEPPYVSQTGNNCTSEAVQRVADLMQCMDVADPPDGATDAPLPERMCVEATYAFGLAEAGMRGDEGCYGGAMAKGASEVGTVPYRLVGGPYEETRSRLVQFANNPSAVVAKYKDVAGKARFGSIAQITTFAELRAAYANRGLVTFASNWGFETNRQSNGIMEPAGSWPHQMAGAGVIDSDGVETAVFLQSWGPGNPNGFGRNPAYIGGNQPFKLPSFAFRVRRQYVERILAQGDTWAFFKHPGFQRKPLPSKWTNTGWAA